MTRVSLSPTCAQYKRCGRGRSNDTSGTERPSPDPASTSKCQDVKKSMFALFHLDAVLVIPFAGEGEEEIGMLPSKHAEPVLVAESQFHLVPKIGFVLK